MSMIERTFALRWIIPFRYFIATRIASRRAMIAWGLTYLFPVIMLAIVASPMPVGDSILAAAMLVIIVYACYEYGYLFNDTITVKLESNPTFRIGEIERQAISLALPMIFRWRLGITLVCALSYSLVVMRSGWSAFGAFISASLLGGAILCVYYVYNRVRNRSSVGIFLLLVTLRFGGPIIVVAWINGIDFGIIAATMLLYPVPNTVEFGGRSRFAIALAGFIARHVDEWRPIYYLIACSYVYIYDSHTNLSLKILIFGASYFLAYRLITLVISLVFRRNVRPLPRSL
jgi:hypothetical protein